MIILGLIFLLFFTISIINKRKITAQKELQIIKSEHEKELLQTKLEMQENTFQKISREIHDNISLGLTLAKLNTTLS